jgi:solute:Na+ symporter, SSS family
LLTIGDFYKVRYGKSVEVLTSTAIVISYLGWTSAQLTALGLIIHVLVFGGGGAGPRHHDGRGRGAWCTPCLAACGRWRSPTCFKVVIIVVGLGLVAMAGGRAHAGGFEKVIAAGGRSKANSTCFRPTWVQLAGWAMAGAFFAFAFGSIPQQDVFQRMTSAKDEKTAMRGTIIGGLLYFCDGMPCPSLHRLCGVDGPPRAQGFV